MKNQIQQFHNEEFGSLDIFMIEDKPYFPATNCAALLGYSNPHKAVRDHCREDGCTNRSVIDKLGRTQEKKYINEGNLYRLIIRSKLPTAERFERWVFDEVLPTIRKHGAYATRSKLDELLFGSRSTETLMQKLEKERRKSAVLEKLAIEMAPKALYCDLVLQCKNVVPVSIIAKDYGMSAIAFNAMLHDFGIQFKMNGTWLPYQEYADKGYTKTRIYRTGENIANMHTCWTQKGWLFLYEFLKDFGILPIMESHQESQQDVSFLMLTI
jgi:prophage antirepressor-like protein